MLNGQTTIYHKDEVITYTSVNEYGTWQYNDHFKWYTADSNGTTNFPTGDVANSRATYSLNGKVYAYYWYVLNQARDAKDYLHTDVSQGWWECLSDTP